MQVTFVSHASLICSAGDIGILSDPWYEGKVFNNGWDLISPPAPVDYDAVTHIWISHEHPDHLHFPTLKKIAAAHGDRITILYQRHASPRIVDAVRKLGFRRVVELPLYRWQELAAGVWVLCGSLGSMDSFLAVRDGRDVVLNMNDCVINAEQARYIKRKVGAVSLLVTQFSFASWVGNDTDERHGAESSIASLRTQIATFQPRATVPAASFTYFCSRENARANAWINTPAKIAPLGIPTLEFMYPGDVWSSDRPAFETARAIERYERDFAARAIDPTPERVPIEKISAALETFLAQMRKKFAAQVRKLPAFAIHVHDLGKIVTVRPGTLTYEVADADPAAAARARYVMCSQVTYYLFAFTWGSNTVEISGMYLDREFSTRGRNRFFLYQQLLSTQVLEFGSPRQSLRTLAFLWHKRWELFFRLTGRRAQHV